MTESIERLFERARSLPPESLQGFLEEIGDQDPELRTELESLLRHDLSTAGWGDWCTRLMEAQPEPVPERIGAFRILRRLGAGGMGVVYLAEQLSPPRRVALKALRPHEATPAVQRRFSREIGILARLEHPGIARIYESGIDRAHSGERPFFTMEWVDGCTLSEELRARPRSPEEKIDLFQRICSAVAHAHSRGIVHRDLKPENVVVDRDGLPKVVDFGIARPDRRGPRHTTELTGTGTPMGTLSYMSPEQVSGEAIDERTDVYALGLMLFQILAGRLPHEITNRFDARRIICEEVPPPLSRFDERWRGDLDQVVGKALEKEPQRRYGSAGELGEDLRRYREGLPILARRASLTYRTARFVRRHRALTASSLSLLLVLVAGLVTSLRFWRSAEESRRQLLTLYTAQEELVEEQRARLSITETMRQIIIDPAMTAGTLAADLRADHVRLYLTVVDDEEEVMEVAALGIAQLRAIGRRHEAAQILDAVHEQWASRIAVESPACDPIAREEALLEVDAAAACAKLHLLLQRQEARGDSRAARHTRLALSSRLLERRLGEEGLKYASEALRSFAELPGEDQLGLARSMTQVANGLRILGRLDDADRLYAHGLSEAMAQVEPEHPAVLILQANRTLLASDRRDWPQIVTEAPELIRALESVYGPASTAVAKVTIAYGVALSSVSPRRDAEARRVHEELLRHLRSRGISEDSELVASQLALAQTLMNLGEHEEADDVYQEGIAACLRIHGRESPRTLSARTSYSALLWVRERHADALGVLDRALEDARSLAPDNLRTLEARANRAYVLTALGDTEAAGHEFRAVVRHRSRILGPGSPASRNVALSSVEALVRAEAMDEAGLVLAHFIAELQRSTPRESELLDSCRATMDGLQDHALAKSFSAFDSALDARHPKDPFPLQSAERLGRLLVEAERDDEAMELWERALMESDDRANPASLSIVHSGLAALVHPSDAGWSAELMGEARRLLDPCEPWSEALWCLESAELRIAKSR